MCQFSVALQLTVNQCRHHTKPHQVPTQTICKPKTNPAQYRRKQPREFARQRKKYTQSSIHIALSRPEPIEKSVQGRCRAICPAQGVQRGDEIHPCASHGCECLSSQKRLLRGGCYAARSRTQGRGGQAGSGKSQ